MADGGEEDTPWYEMGWVRERTRSQTARARGARGARGTPRGRGSYRARQYVHSFSYRRSANADEPQEEQEGPPPPQDFRRGDDGRTPYVHDPTNALGRSRPAGHPSLTEKATVDQTVDDDDKSQVSDRSQPSKTPSRLEGGRQPDDRRSEASDRSPPRLTPQRDVDATEKKRREASGIDPVLNPRVQALLDSAKPPSREPEFDAFSSDDRINGKNNPLHDRRRESGRLGQSWSRSSCDKNESTTRWVQETQPAFPTFSRDGPPEILTKDKRGDVYPKAAAGITPASRTRSRRKRGDDGPLPSEAESVPPHTAHGQYLQRLLKRYEDRERDRMTQRRAPSVTSQVDTQVSCSDVASCRFSYTSRPRKSGLKLGAPPPYDDGQPDQEREELENELQRARQEIQELRYQLNACPPTPNRDGPDDDNQFAFGNAGNRPFQNRYDNGRSQRREDYRHIKLPKFKGKSDEYPAFKQAFIRCAQLMKFTDEEAQTQLICCLEGSARGSVVNMQRGSTVHDMLHVLDSRYGYNLSVADVCNKLTEIRRKPKEDLHSLYDRVMNTVRRADMPSPERAQKARDTFFQALQPNRRLQHYVGRNDKQNPPNIDLTLALAIQHELEYGRDPSPPSTRVRQVNDTDQPDDTGDATQVNQLTFTSLAGAKDPVVKKLGKQTNELVELVKKQHELFTKHLTTNGDKFSKKPSTSNKQSSSGNQSTSKNNSSSTSGNKKPWLKNKGNKNYQKGNKRSKVNEVDDQPEEGECEEEEESGADEQQSDTASTADL